MKKVLLVSCFNWYDRRLRLIAEYFSDYGCETKVVLSDFNHVKKAYYDKKNDHCTYVHVPSYKKNISIRRIYSHLYFGKKTRLIMDDYKPDLIYVLIPPNNIAKKCVDYKNSNPSVHLIVDIIDLWPESMPIGLIKHTLLSRVWRKWRQDCIQKASFVFTECDYYQEVLKDELREKQFASLHIYKDKNQTVESIVNSTNYLSPPHKKLRFAYLGSMNNILDIDGICWLFSELIKRGYSVDLHAIGGGDHKEQFFEKISTIGCNPKFYGMIFDPIEIAKKLCGCDFALNMMKDSVMVGLSIKSLDYMSMGIPLVNNIKGDTWDLVKKYSLGINIDRSSDNTVDRLLESDLSQMRNNTIKTYNDLFTENSFLKTLSDSFSKMEFL